MKYNKFAVSLMAITALLFVGCSGVSNKEVKGKLNVYNWGDYIDEDVVEMFEKETGIKVVYETYGSNEDMYTKIKNGGSNYDIVVPSEYMIQKMINEDMLEKINFNNIPNIKNIDEKFKNLPYDPQNEFSVPYTWGTLGILYNKDMVKEEINSFDILWDEKYKNKIFMYDSQRDSFAASLRRLGYSINTTNQDEINEATEQLLLQKSLVQAYVGDPVKDKMIGNEGALALVYSGDAMASMKENDSLDYIVPNEGSNLFFDSIAIPKGSKNKAEAEAFIDFLCRPDIAVKNTQYIGYSTANLEAYKLLPEDLRENKIYWPSDETINKSEIFQDLGDKIKMYDDAWIKVFISK